ncbi:hypothetical protein B0H14DRAFT_3507306 [Mycena olivaceomarginata]|nr:hypothetical protein B0H14DRAFT_3507306 [Mycena olivaceomarginata]
MSALQAWTMYYIANMELINSSWSGKSDVAELQKRAVALRTLAVAYEAQTRTTTRQERRAHADDDARTPRRPRRPHRHDAPTPRRAPTTTRHTDHDAPPDHDAPTADHDAPTADHDTPTPTTPTTTRPQPMTRPQPTTTRLQPPTTTRPRRPRSAHEAPTPTQFESKKSKTEVWWVRAWELMFGKQVQRHIASFFSTTIAVSLPVSPSLPVSLPSLPLPPIHPSLPSLPPLPIAFITFIFFTPGPPDLRSTPCNLFRARCAALSRARVQNAHPRASTSFLSFLSTTQRTAHHRRPVHHSKVALAPSPPSFARSLAPCSPPSLAPLAPFAPSSLLPPLPSPPLAAPLPSSPVLPPLPSLLVSLPCSPRSLAP